MEAEDLELEVGNSDGGVAQQIKVKCGAGACPDMKLIERITVLANPF